VHALSLAVSDPLPRLPGVNRPRGGKCGAADGHGGRQSEGGDYRIESWYQAFRQEDVDLFEDSMKAGLKLFAKITAGEAPPKAMLFALLNRASLFLGLKTQRFAFERLYSERADPWSYRTSGYEMQKYQRTLDCILALRKSSESVLEVGCSIGVFSSMLADVFNQVTATDISKEALRKANRKKSNTTRFVQTDIRKLAIGHQFDVIVCAEVLYYISETDADLVCRKLDKHLKPNGVIIVTSGVREIPWEDKLSKYFLRVYHDVVSDADRPYEIFAFSHRG
jgi:SAM-dependent methyltransferase